MELSPSWKAANCAAAHELPAFYETWRFIAVFTRALHWSLSWARSIQSIPSYPVSLRSILLLPTHLRLGLPSGLFPSGFPTTILYAFLFSPFVPRERDRIEYYSLRTSLIRFIFEKLSHLKHFEPCKTRTNINVFIRARLWSLLWASLIIPRPDNLSLFKSHFIMILHLCLSTCAYVGVRFLGGVIDFFFSTGSDLHPISYPVATMGPCPRSVRLITHIYLVLWFRICGAIPSFRLKSSLCHD
jgi:hypothetical protein